MSRWRSSACNGIIGGVAFALAGTATAQLPPQPGEAVHSRRVLHRAATELVRGERGPARQEVGGWSVAQLETRIADTRPARGLLDRWNPFRSTDPSYARWTEPLLAAAATVHLLTAIDPAVAITDRERDLHADAAETLAAALDHVAFDREVRTGIYIVLIQRHQRRLRPQPVMALIDRMPADLRDRAPVLMARGWAAELRASPRNEDRLSATQRLDSLEEASALYARAAAAATVGSEAARLRHARVQQLIGNGATAEPLLRQVSSASTAEDTRYLAALFLGILAADENRPEDARDHFRQALTLRPTAQSVRMAWSHAAFRMDDRAGAREHVLATAGRSAAPACADDPWCLYDFGDAARPAEAIERLLRVLGS